MIHAGRLKMFPVYAHLKRPTKGLKRIITVFTTVENGGPLLVNWENKTHFARFVWMKGEQRQVLWLIILSQLTAVETFGRLIICSVYVRSAMLQNQGGTEEANNK